MPEFDFLLKVSLFRKCLKAQQAVIHDFWVKAQSLLAGSEIHLKSIPKSWLNLRHNYFSVLFIAMFHVLDIPAPRLTLYARLNHCLRSWVTACDNLLDNELKEIILTDLPAKAHTFKSVHTILLTDRIFFSFLMDALDQDIINAKEMEHLLNISLSAISASGREEAEEEGGVMDVPTPEEILQQVHLAKTGHLFAAPLSAPAVLGDIDLSQPTAAQAKAGLMTFGLGCQILDDISDLGLDIIDRKYNYLFSLIHHQGTPAEKKQLQKFCQEGHLSDHNKLYQAFSRASQQALTDATQQLKKALRSLSDCGLPLSKLNRDIFIKILVSVFRHPERFFNLRDR
jgi:hypothetical protein